MVLYWKLKRKMCIEENYSLVLPLKSPNQTKYIVSICADVIIVDQVATVTPLIRLHITLHYNMYRLVVYNHDWKRQPDSL